MPRARAFVRLADLVGTARSRRCVLKRSGGMNGTTSVFAPSASCSSSALARVADRRLHVLGAISRPASASRAAARRRHAVQTAKLDAAIGQPLDHRGKSRAASARKL
jgi:hypothetical protein